MSFYDLKMMNNKNEEVAMSNYEGKVVLVVNTATGCGFTPQYEALEKMYEDFKDKGFEILDFPCNGFLFQAPGSDEKIDSFCTLKYNTTFPRFTKSKVNGKDANPVFKFLTDKENGFGGKIKWNFTKFLIDRTGKIVNRFEPTEKPESFYKIVEELVNRA